jgi:hypothetical protein
MPSRKRALAPVPKGKPATIAEMAQVEFRALKALRGLSRQDITAKFSGLTGFLGPMAVAAGEIVALEKAELITRVAEHYDVLGPLLMQLAEATSDAKLLVDVIQAAECRLAVALANVEGGRTS